MAYQILNTDGTILLTLADGTIDKSATSLSLIGRNYSAYGEEYNNNLVKLLANFASSSGTPPRSPLRGQLWYDTTVRRLKIYDNGFKVVGAASISNSQPADLQNGDLWFDSGLRQLKIYISGAVYTVGPSFPPVIGSSGLVLPETKISDTSDVAKNVLLLRSYGSTLGVVYNDSSGNKKPFDIKSSDKTTYIPTANTSTIVSGLTLVGDLNVNGKLSNNYLSLYVELNDINPNPKNDVLAFYPGNNWAVAVQNPNIATLLNSVFPPNPTTLTNTTTVMSGLLLGTQARVLCKYTKILGEDLATPGYQIRVFRTVGDYTTATWQPYYFATATIAGNQVAVNYISSSTTLQA